MTASDGGGARVTLRDGEERRTVPLEQVAARAAVRVEPFRRSRRSRRFESQHDFPGWWWFVRIDRQAIHMSEVGIDISLPLARP